MNLATVRSGHRQWKIAGAALAAAIVLPILLFAKSCTTSDPDDPMPVASATVQTIVNTYCAEEGCHRWAIYDPDTGYWYPFQATIDQAQALDAQGFEVQTLPDQPPLATQEQAGGDGSIGVGTLLRRFWWAFPLIVGFWVFGRYGLGRKPGPGQ